MIKTLFLIQSRICFLSCLFFYVPVATGQQYYTTTATSTFEVQAPAKKIKGISNAVSIDLDLKQGTVTVKVPVNTFRFENNFISDSLNATIRERFNNHYMESNRFPLITYTGKLQKAATGDRNNVLHTKGTLLLHGTAQPVIATYWLEPGPGQAIVHAAITVQPNTWGIRIPAYIGDMYFREVNIEITGTLKTRAKSKKEK